ncbi:MAG TPA: DUF4142 domain-containing protein [Cellvibrio sp.]|nr:DUF4142 domain-containing protein [Cellvibrio sp.]
MKYLNRLGAGVVFLAASLVCGKSLATPVFDSQRFVEIAAEKSISEMEMAKLAMSKSDNVHIRSYAENIIKEQSLALDSLRAFAVKENLAMASDAELRKNAWTIVLEREGMSFDMAYADMRAEERKKVVNLYRSAIRSPNIAFRNHATDMLPLLMQELYQAQQLTQQLNIDKALSDKKMLVESSSSFAPVERL